VIKKQLLLSLFFLSFFCFPSIIAQTEKRKQPLIDIFEQLHSRFECNFSFIDSDVRNILVEPPDEKFDLKQTIAYLQKNTPLKFTILGEKFITITQKKTTFSICGYLIDINTNDIISGAVIQSKNYSTISDDKGYFYIPNVVKNEIISIRHLSFEMYTEYVDALRSKQCESIYLISKREDLSEIVLSNYLTNGINKIIDGSISINYKNFGTIPGLIETDVLKTIQALPGFQSIDETVSNINIHGGTHDQNLIIWDGIKIYQAGHFFGLISSLNPRITKKVALIKNGTPASYTDGISGTIDMNSDQAINKKLSTEAGFNFINADVFVDVPINEESSIQIASRKSFSELFNSPTYSRYFDRAFQNTDVVTSTNNTNSSDKKFDFYDISLRWLYKISDKDNLRVNFLNVNNNLVFTENAFGGGLSASRESALDQKNIAGGLHYERIWNQKFKTSIQFYGTDYNLDATNFDIINEQILVQKNKISETGIDINSNYVLNDQISLKNGYHLVETGITNSEKVNNPPVDSSIKEIIRTQAISTEIDYTTKNQNTHLKFGTRFNYFNRFHKFIIEPRLSINQRLTDDLSIELLGEFKNQTKTLLTDFRNDFLGVERRRWTVSNNDNIPILKSKQISFGSSYNLAGLMIVSELYYKTVTGLTSQSQGFQNQYEFTKSIGEYNIKGFDLAINHKFNKFNSWLSYSFEDNNYIFSELPDNNFPSNLDITHTFSFANTYNYKNLKLSAGINWRSGKPTTKPIGDEIINNKINYATANSSRLDPYFRLDASAIYDFNISKKIKAQTGLSVLNITNKKNVINSFYSIDEASAVKEIKEYSLGITPNFAFRVFF
jgi:hypothetical protein